MSDDDDRQENANYDENGTEEQEKNMFLRERLRQYLFKEALEAMRDQIGDEGDYDVNNDWLRSKLYPAYDNIYSGFILPVFTSF